MNINQLFETDKIKKRGHSHTLSFLLKLPRNSGVFFQKEGKEKKSSPSGSSFQVKFIWSSNEAHLILGRMYLKLRRDVSGTASGRTRCYVGTQFREQHWRLYGKNSIKNTAKNHQKRLSIAIFMAIYGRLWQLKSYCNIGTFS